jgi:hypothetical protein
LIDAGEHTAVEQGLQQFLGANIQLLGQLANGNPFRNCDCARFAFNGRNLFNLCSASGACACARTHGMKFSLPFRVSLFNQRAPA